MFPKMDPEKMKEVQAISGQIRGEIRVDHKENTINMAFKTENPDAKNMLQRLVPQFAEAMAQQLGAFFNIKGEIIDVNKEG